MTGRIDAPRVGVLMAGSRNSIADVAAVTVDHATITPAVEAVERAIVDALFAAETVRRFRDP